MSFKKYIIYILCFLVLSDILRNVGNTGFANEFFTPVSLFAAYVSLILLIKFSQQSNWRENLPGSIANIYFLLLSWNIITLIHGAFTAIGYWDWKFLFLGSAPFLLIPLAFFMGKSLNVVRLISYYTLRYILPYGFILLPIGLATNEELYSRIMVPVTFFLVFIPYVQKKHKFLILIVAVVSILAILDFRTNIIKIAIGFLTLFTFYFRRIIGVFWIRVVHFTLFLAPIVLLFLALTNQFNIFTKLSENEGYSVKTKAFEQSNLAADTRTFLYVEVFSSLEKSGNWLYGEGAVGKYRTEYFSDLITGNMRFGTEVGFLNTLLYSGIIGVFLYCLILLYTSYYAIYKSNNWLCKMLGLIIASRWLLFFLEEFTSFDLNFYFLWIIIGLIGSNKFRGMSNDDIVDFFSFKRYNKMYDGKS